MPLDDAAQYWIARGQQTFGPYTGAQVREYVASGNIALADLIKGERDTEWMPVSFAMHATPVPPSAPPGAPPTAPAGGYVPPPGYVPPAYGQPTDSASGLAWTSLILGIVGLLCCGVFAAIPGLIFGIVAMKRPPGPSRPIAIAGVVINIIGLIFGILGLIILLVFPQFLPQGFAPLGP